LKVAQIYISKSIDYEDSTFEGIVKSLKSQMPYDEIYVWINSDGGHIGEAIAIFQYLNKEKEKGIKVTTHAQNYCDSSAIIIFLAGDIRKIDEFNQNFLVHRIWDRAEGNPDQIRAGLKQAEKTENDILDIYEEVTKIEKDFFKNLMSEERSLNIDEILKYNFATEKHENNYGLAYNLNRELYELQYSFAKNKNANEEEIKQRRIEYKKNVNMSFSELKKWSETECSKEAGLDRKPIARNLHLLNIEASKWGQKEFNWAGKTISFINRMKKNLGSQNIIIDKNGKECGTKAEISLKNWAFDPKKKARNHNYNKMSEFNYKAVNKKASFLQKLQAKKLKISVEEFLAQKAINMLGEYLEKNKEMPKNMLIKLDDGTPLYVFSDTEDIEGKRVVIADADGEPTEEPAPDGKHMLESRKIILVENGMISQIMQASENMDKSKEENMEEKPKNPGDHEKKEENKKEENMTEKSKNQRKLEQEIEALKKMITTQHKPKNATGNMGATPDLEKQQNKRPYFATNLSESAKKHLINEHATYIKNFGAYSLNMNDALKEKSKFAKNANEIVFVDNDYVGDYRADLLAEALLGANDINVWTVIDGIKDERRLSRITNSVTFKDRSAEFNASGNDVTIDYSRKLTMRNYGVQEAVSVLALKQAWHNGTLSPGSLGDYNSEIINNWWINEIVKLSTIQNAILRWQGKAGLTPQSLSGSNPELVGRLIPTFTDPYLGLIPLLESDPDTSKQSLLSITSSNIDINTVQSLGTTTVLELSSVANLSVGDTLTISGLLDGGGGNIATALNGTYGQIVEIDSASNVTLRINTTGLVIGTPDYTNAKVSFINESNIIEIMKILYARVPKPIFDKDDFRIFIPPTMQRYYEFATSSVATGDGDYFLSKRELAFLSKKLEVINYMPENKILCAQTSNIFYGVDLLSDETQVNFVDTSKTTNSMLKTLRIDMKSDVQVGYTEECTLIF